MRGAAALRGTETLKFTFKTAGFPREGFVLKVRGGFKAYLNRCPHAGAPLDFGDNDFFTDDKRRLLCRTHGAEFDPASGLCVAGPCAGESLTRFPVAPGRGKTVDVTLSEDIVPEKLV